MSGCLMYSLRRYHLRTGDERARDALLKIADFLVDVIWRPELGGFLAKESRRYTPVGRPNQRSIVGLPYAYRLNPRQKCLDVFAENQAHVRRIVGPGLSSQQKAFAWATRFPPLSWYDYTQIGAPIAHAGDDAFLSDDLTADLDGSASRALGGQRITKSEWDFGDGQKGKGLRVTHRYAEPGDYTATLTVTTESGAAARDSVRVRHLPAGNHLLNGSFEDDADRDGKPDHWDVRVTHGKATVTLDSEVAHSGRRSVRIAVAGQPSIVHVRQLDRPLPPGRKYVLSCWLKMDNVAKIDETGMRTGTYLIAYPRPQLVWRCVSPSGPDVGTAPWRKYEATFTSKPTDRAIDVYCKLRRCTGTAWFDDVCLEPTD